MEVGCIPSICKLRNAWQSRRFIWFHREAAWTGTFLYAQNALRMCEAWAPGCFARCDISHIDQVNTRCNGSFTGPFQTQLPLRGHFHISSHPFSANIKWFTPHFRILSLKKKNALCSLLSLNQKALLLMKGSLKNHSLFVFPALFHPVTFSTEVDVYVAFCCLSLSRKLYFFCCFWSMKDVCWVGRK